MITATSGPWKKKQIGTSYVNAQEEWSDQNSTLTPDPDGRVADSVAAREAMARTEHGKVQGCAAGHEQASDY